MKKSLLKSLSLLVIVVLLAMTFAGCGQPVEEASPDSGSPAAAEPVAPEETPGSEGQAAPKYVFLFIGDGMSFPQISALGYYNGTLEHSFTGTLKEPTPDNIPQAEMPSFVTFPVVGACTTYDASKFITDSASAATAIASGTKTLDGIIGQDAFNNSVPSIAELVRDKTDYNVGVITSVSLDHATPAAFYAHVASRNQYYDISRDLVKSGFTYFGGGGFLQPKGPEGDQEDILELAEAAGYTIANSIEEIEALNAESGKVIAINPVLDPVAAMPWRIDRDSQTSLALKDFVRKGIDVMGDEQGFFMMVESGKIDWACHANDAITAIMEVKELEEAVNVAVEFAQKHPEETLIIVTGDHETGGFSNGFQGTEYDTYFGLLTAQTVSNLVYTDDYVAHYIENQTTFEEAMVDVKNLFGLISPDDPDAATWPDQALVLTEKDMRMFRDAYEQTMIPPADRDVRDQEYRELYGTYKAEPIVITATHIINNKAGIGWSTTSHSALPTAVFARGAGQEVFSDFYDNTDIFLKLQELLQLK